MHEASIAQNILEALTARVEQGEIVGRIRVVHLKVGKLTAVIPDHMKFMFEMTVQGTLLEGASLHIEEVPIRARCRACGAETALEEPLLLCQACHEGTLEVLDGRELLIDAVEVD